jgi:uncharacterized protein (TIGR02246 family)
MKSRIALACICAAMAASPFQVLARSETCHAASEKDIAGLFDRWNASLATGDPKKVVANYATKSILLPTVSNQLRLTPAEREDYFVMFLTKKPQGKIDQRMIEIDCNSALDAGIYTFTFGDGSKVQARYSYTYKWDGKQWLITSHHSSAMPEK